MSIASLPPPSLDKRSLQPEVSVLPSWRLTGVGRIAAGTVSIKFCYGDLYFLKARGASRDGPFCVCIAQNATHCTGTDCILASDDLHKWICVKTTRQPKPYKVLCTVLVSVHCALLTDNLWECVSASASGGRVERQWLWYLLAMTQHCGRVDTIMMDAFKWPLQLAPLYNTPQAHGGGAVSAYLQGEWILFQIHVS